MAFGGGFFDTKRNSTPLDLSLKTDMALDATTATFTNNSTLEDSLKLKSATAALNRSTRSKLVKEYFCKQKFIRQQSPEHLSGQKMQQSL